MTDNSNGASAGVKVFYLGDVMQMTNPPYGKYLNEPPKGEEKYFREAVLKKDYDALKAELAQAHTNLEECSGYCEHLDKENNTLRAQCKDLVEGLEFYARPIDYLVHHSMGYGLSRNENNMSRMEADSGNLARSILSKFKDSVGG